MANTSIPAGSHTGTVALAPPETITGRPLELADRDAVVALLTAVTRYARVMRREPLGLYARGSP